jgi:hypothetical protein
MPKHRLIQPFAQFAGSVKDLMADSGLVLYSSSTAGNCSRQWVTPANPGSPNQLLVRGFLTQAAAAYKALSAANAAAWDSMARAITLTDSLGNKFDMTGIGLFVRVNSYRLMTSQAIASAPPAYTAEPAPSAIAGNIDSSNFVVDVTATNVSNGAFILLRGTGDLGGAARNARHNECAMYGQGTISDNVTIVATHLASYNFIAAEVNITVGDHIGLLATSISANGYPGGSLFVKNSEVT